MQFWTRASCNKPISSWYLRQIWLGQYNRGGGIQGSSGLEHIFLGEKDGNSISGYHGWIKFYRDEQAGRMNYLGIFKLRNIYSFESKTELRH